MVTKFAMLNIQWILARSEPEAKIICLPHDSIADVGDTLVSLDFLQFKKCIINAFGNYMFMLAEEDTWMCLWERAFFCNQKGIWKRLFEDNMGLMLSRVESRAGGFDFEVRLLHLPIILLVFLFLY